MVILVRHVFLEEEDGNLGVARCEAGVTLFKKNWENKVHVFSTLTTEEYLILRK